MKYLYIKLLFILLIFQTNKANSQSLSGTYTIDGTFATFGTNFATFTEAISALNSQGVDTSIGVVFEVPGGQVFYERPPAIFVSGGVINPILFTKTGTGPNPIIKPNVPGTLTSTALGNFADGVFRIAGADNININAINIDTNGLFTNAIQAYEYGYMLLRRDANNGCKNIRISNCTIQSLPSLLHSSGIFSASFDSTGLAVTVASEPGRMENVILKSNIIRNSHHGIQLRGFNHSTSPNNLYDHFVSIDSNTVIAFGGFATEANGIYAIYLDSSQITNNNINSATTAANTYGIRTEVALNATFSVIGNNVTVNNTSGILYPIFNNAGGTGVNNFISVSHNKIFNCSTSGSSLYGIRAQASATLLHISHNEIFNNTNSGTGASYLIWSIPGGATQSRVFNNKIYNNLVSNTSNNSTLYPYICNTTTGSTHVFNNEIYNITHLGGGTGSLIINRSNAANFYCYNNFISRLYTPNATGLDAIRAIELNTGANQKVLFNTVYLDSSSNSTLNYGNSVLYIATGVTAEVRNNILVNRSIPGLSGGFTVVYRRSNATLTSYDLASNNNCFYTDSAFTRRVVFNDGTNISAGISGFQNLVGPTRDSLSMFVLPPFINVLTAPYDLRLSTLFTPLASAGTPVTTPLITQDIFGNLRNPLTPDIGAYEVSTVLPVQLSYFNAFYKSPNVVLNWKTASEINNAGFTIERSNDAISFEPIGFVKGMGNSSKTNAYVFEDNNPFEHTNTLFYRLKQIDYNGKFEFSPVVSLTLTKNMEQAVNVLPNPFNTELFVELPFQTKEAIKLELINLNGKTICAETFYQTESSPTIQWQNLNNIQSGIYMLKVIIDGQTSYHKLMKN